VGGFSMVDRLCGLCESTTYLQRSVSETGLELAALLKRYVML
jgi:hypothetical protein